MYVILVSLGIFCRFFVMAVGHNFDFESYCIVGEIAGNLRNVYAETSRYNYGFVFFCIQGLLYRIAHIHGEEWVQVYRVLIVMVLIAADLGIAGFIAKRYSMKKSLLFFLNPVSIIITGYHNQFDNIAVFIALFCIIFYNEQSQFQKKDALFIVFLSLSLIIKHILIFMPIFILLKKGLPLRKKIVYAFAPPILFFLSFLPFMIGNMEAFYGILNNVFLYRSFNNAPIFGILYHMIHFPMTPRFFIYALIMCVIAYRIRGIAFEELLLLYLIAMVAFSSAIANQYLAIPMIALCVLDVGYWDKVYMLVAGGFLIFEGNGLHIYGWLETHHYLPDSIMYLMRLYLAGGYILAAWILCAAFVCGIRNIERSK